MQTIIDRFEGHWAICETPDRAFIKVLRQNIPSEAREGDVLQIEGESIRLDLAATAARKKAAAKRFLQMRQPD
jgi:hypothetical protein